MKSNPDYVPGHLGLSRVLVEERKWEEALRSVDRAYELSPDDLDVQYYKGIIHRELSKFDVLYAPRYRVRAKELFNQIIAADSSHRAVFHELSLLYRYLGEFPEAIRLSHRQLDVHSDLAATHIGLHRTYRHFFQFGGEEEIATFLEEETEPYRTFFQAVSDRKSGRYNFASGRLESLLNDSTISMPLQPILLERARLLYADRQNVRAQDLVMRALEESSSEAELQFLYEDFKYVFEDAELGKYNSLTDLDEKKALFRAMWEKRDPMPGRKENVRLTEHYTRLLEAEKSYLYYGIRSWHNNPDKAGYLSLPSALFLNEDFNDKGLVYIRNGEPIDKVTHVGGPDNFFRTQVLGLETANWLPSERQYNTGYSLNESWRYADPILDFHFVVADNEENNWRLIPLLTSFEMLESREHWGDPYATMVRALRAQLQMQEGTTGNFAFNAALEDGNTEFDSLSANSPTISSFSQPGQAMRFELEIEETRQLMIDKSQESVEVGLKRDRHTWGKDVEPMPLPHMVVTFRGEEGATELDMYYALPLGKISDSWEGEEDKIPVETGYAIHDTTWAVIQEQAVTKRLPRTTDKTAAVIDFYRATVLPDTYTVALHGFPENLNLMGGYKFGLNVPDYSGQDLMMSDLLMAHRIEPILMGNSRFERKGHKIESNPFQRYSVNQIVYIYFEIYNLTYDSDDFTRYEIEYILTPDSKGKGRRARRRARPVLTLKVERAGDMRSPVEYAEFDVQQVDPAYYTMTIRITDMNTGQSTENSQRFELTK